MDQTRHSNSLNIDTILAISKKHWATYIIPVLFLLLIWPFLLSKYYLLGIPILIFAVIRILSNRSTCWILTNEDLIIKSGFVPWRKTYFEIPIDDIYEAYYSKSLLGNIFGFGHLSVRRTEGTTSMFYCSGMTDPQAITGSINSLVREIKKSSRNQTMNYTNHLSLADELQKLVELKNQGILNEDEFNSQKQRLLN